MRKRGGALRRENRDFLECVREALEKRLASMIPDADEIAQRLGVSPQGMRDRLREQGTSLEQITAQVLAGPASRLQ